MTQLRNSLARPAQSDKSLSASRQKPTKRQDDGDHNYQKRYDAAFKIDGLTLEPEETAIYRSPQAFVQTAIDYIPRYSHKNAILNALDLLGIPRGVKHEPQQVVRIYRQLAHYASLRDSGLSQDDAIKEANARAAALAG